MKKWKITLCCMVFVLVSSAVSPISATVVGTDDYSDISSEGAPSAQPAAPTPAPETSPVLVPKKNSSKKNKQTEKPPEITQENIVLENTVSENTVSENTVSENTVSENTVSENTVPENTVSENEVPKDPIKKQPKLEDAEKSREPVEQITKASQVKKSKYIVITIILAYIVILIAVFNVWILFFSPMLLARNGEGIYKIVGPVLCRSKKEGYLIKIPKSYEKRFGEEGNLQLKFPTAFQNEHQGEELNIIVAGSEIISTINDSVLFTI